MSIDQVKNCFLVSVYCLIVIHKWWWMDDIWLLSRLSVVYTLWYVLAWAPSSKPDTHTRAARAECPCVHVKMSSVDARRAHGHSARWHWTWGVRKIISEERVKKHKIEIQKEWEKKVESEWRPLSKKIKTAMENYKEKGWYHHTLMFCLVEIKICDYLIDGMS